MALILRQELPLLDNVSSSLSNEGNSKTDCKSISLSNNYRYNFKKNQINFEQKPHLKR